MDIKKYSFNAEKYLSYRTEYPKEFINYLYENVGLRHNSIIADIGSGTGKLSKELLLNGGKYNNKKCEHRFYYRWNCLSLV